MFRTHFKQERIAPPFTEVWHNPAAKGFQQAMIEAHSALGRYSDLRNMAPHKLQELHDLVQNTHRALIQDTSHSVDDHKSYGKIVGDQFGRLNLLFLELEQKPEMVGTDVGHYLRQLERAEREIGSYHQSIHDAAAQHETGGGHADWATTA